MKLDITGEGDFDEETGKTIDASACPMCGGVVEVDGGEIACLACGLVLNEYARTGEVPARRRADGHSAEEAA